MDVALYAALAPSSVPPGEAYAALISKGAHLRSFAFGATADEATAKAEAHIAAEEAKAAKYRKPGKAEQAAANIEEAV